MNEGMKVEIDHVFSRVLMRGGTEEEPNEAAVNYVFDCQEDFFFFLHHKFSHSPDGGGVKTQICIHFFF